MRVIIHHKMSKLCQHMFLFSGGLKFKLLDYLENEFVYKHDFEQ